MMTLQRMPGDLSPSQLKSFRFNLARDVPKVLHCDDNGYASRLLWEIMTDLQNAFARCPNTRHGDYAFPGQRESDRTFPSHDDYVEVKL